MGRVLQLLSLSGSAAGAQHPVRKGSRIMPGISPEILKMIRDLSINMASKSISK